MRKIIPVFCAVLVLSSFAKAKEIFENPLENLDFVYSEESIRKYIDRADSTKKTRVEQAFSNATGNGLREAFCPHFANLWLGKDLDQTNAQLLEILTTEDPEVQQKFRLNDHWCLAINQQFYHMYHAFGSKGSVSPGRLYPETEKELLALLWDRMEYKDDIHLARLTAFSLAKKSTQSGKNI